MKKNIKSFAISLVLALPLGGVGGGLLSSCSDSYMEEMNTDDTKAESIDPSAQLTTALLQTYGDFGFMDTYRSYITGFTQHFAGGWNVSNYAGDVHPQDDQMRLVWDQFYSVGIKNLVDAIANSAPADAATVSEALASGSKPNTNAALRIHRVYMMNILTDIYGDIPCMDAGKGYTDGISTPKYDKQEDIYNFFFDELAACAEQLTVGADVIGGDVTSLGGDPAAWKRYANTLRLRYAMRISDVNPTKAKEEFEKALNADGGIIENAEQDAYIIYTDGPFTLYDGSRDLDFRVNALGEILYGQDPTSPTFVCSTLYDILKAYDDPRLYRICRHYINTKRAEVKPDREWNVDVTDEVRRYLERTNTYTPCVPGAAWWSDWVNAPANSEIPTLEKLVAQYPEAGFDQNNFNARMLRPFLSIDFEMPDCPGALINSAEVEFLLAEAKLKGWNVPGTVEEHFHAGIRAAMHWLNDHYLQSKDKISESEIDAYIWVFTDGPLFTTANAKEAINTQAWILHLMNPSEAWANLRRSDYPVIADRTKLPTRPDFPNDEPDKRTPTRLRYPILENQYNSANYQEALDRLGGSDDWHHRLWWDVADINVK